MEKKDWILDNIREIRTKKGIKTQLISKDLGISQSEYSKIENGQRKNYTEFLPQIAKVLGVSFHELVKNNETNFYNYGEIKDNGVGNNNNLYQNHIDKSLYEERIRDKEEMIRVEREQKEYFKAKYYKLKEKLISKEIK